MKLATALTAFLLHNSHSFTPSIRYTDVALTNNAALGTTAERNAPLTKLQAFHLPEGQSSNMFEGPTPLVKERDACGVGFIANTSEGGTLYMFSGFMCCMSIIPVFGCYLLLGVNNFA